MILKIFGSEHTGPEISISWNVQAQLVRGKIAAIDVLNAKTMRCEIQSKKI